MHFHREIGLGKMSVEGYVVNHEIGLGKQAHHQVRVLRVELPRQVAGGDGGQFGHRHLGLEGDLVSGDRNREEWSRRGREAGGDRTRGVVGSFGGGSGEGGTEGA